jgi:predicted aldo/keto reductase-like oxidoreductase
MQIHSPTIERLGYDGAMKIYDELLKMREEGLFRYIGLTTHTAFEAVHKMVSTGGFDQVLLARGYFPVGLDSIHSHRNIEWRELCLAKAHELGMGIVIMKVLGAVVFGHSSKTLVTDFDEKRRGELPAAAIRWVLSDPRVSMLNVGMSLPSDVERNRDVLNAGTELTDADRTLLADFSRQAFESDFVRNTKIV